MPVFNTSVNHSDYNSLSRKRARKLSPLIGMDNIHIGYLARIIIKQRNMVSQGNIFHSRYISSLSQNIHRNGRRIITFMIMTQYHSKRFQTGNSGIIFKDEEQAKTVGREELQAQVDGVEAEIRTLQELARVAAMTLGGLKAQAEQAEKKLAEAAELQGQVNALAGKAAGYEELKKAFSQDGIPHNIIRSIIPIFEATATNILGQMSQGRMSVEFVTEKVLKSNAKKEVTTLDIIINDSDTGRLPYMSRSGGERVKAALSVILALSEIKSSKAGVQLGFLFIDEPPFLDGPGVQAYCDALEAIQQRYGSLKVMAITHDPAMKSRFPQSVDVVKTAEGSKVIYE